MFKNTALFNHKREDKIKRNSVVVGVIVEGDIVAVFIILIN